MQGIIDGLNTLATSESFQTLPARLQDSLASVTALSDELRTQVAASGPKLDKVLDGAAVTVAGANTELPKLSSLVEGNLKVLNGAIAAFEQTMTNVDSLVAPGSATAYQLNKALRELTLASRAIQELANLLDRQPESLLRGKQEDPQ